MKADKTRSFVGAMITARKALTQEARMIEINNLPQCPRCNSICHCDMIEGQKHKMDFVKTGLCPMCQDDVFFGK
jgi:hypothetical protein